MHIIYVGIATHILVVLYSMVLLESKWTTYSTMKGHFIEVTP
jgi:hypothetical protein